MVTPEAAAAAESPKPPASPGTPTSATRTPLPAARPDLSPLPPSPPRTSSSVSSSRPSPLFRGFAANSFAHALTAYLSARTRACASPPRATARHSLFYGIHPPPISTRDYVRRLLAHAHCSPSAFVVALVHLRRVAARHAHLALCPENLHRSVITALTLAVKTLDDRVFSMAHYARVGGVPSAKELARLERQFIDFINGRLFVRRKTFLAMLHRLWDLRHAPLGDDALRPLRPSIPVHDTAAPPRPTITASTDPAMSGAPEPDHAVQAPAAAPATTATATATATVAMTVTESTQPRTQLTAASDTTAASAAAAAGGQKRLKVHGNAKKPRNGGSNPRGERTENEKEDKHEDEDEDEEDKEEPVSIVRTPPQPSRGKSQSQSRLSFMTVHGSNRRRGAPGAPQQQHARRRPETLRRSAYDLPSIEEMSKGPRMMEDDSGALDDDDDDEDVDVDDIEIYQSD